MNKPLYYFFFTYSPCSEIRVNGKRGGMLYSTVFNVGMAMVRMEHLKNPESSFSVGPYRLFPFLPSFLRKPEQN